MFFGFFAYFLFFVQSPLRPNPLLIWFPLLVLQCALIGLGVGLWVAALTTRYQDLRFALTFLTQIWMYATPIVYPASLIVSPTYRLLLWMNPMSFVVECARLMFTGSGTVTMASFVISVSMTLLLLVSGLLVFNRVQRTFVDTI